MKAVQTKYIGVVSKVGVDHVHIDEFSVQVDVHVGSVLSTCVFIILVITGI